MDLQSVGIVGAGLIGRLIAAKLAQQGCHVQLFDRDSRDGLKSCGMAAAGMLAPISEVDKCSKLVVTLGLRSIPMWQHLLSEMALPVYFQQAGSLLVSHPQDMAELQKLQQKLTHEFDAEYFQWVGEQKIAELEPNLAGRFNSGIFLPKEAQLANDEWFLAVAHQLADYNVEWHENCEVTKVTANLIAVEDRYYDFDLVVDCRGLGATRDIPLLRGVRGERLKCFAPGITVNRPIRLMHPRYHLYIVPRPNHYFIVGASEIESNDMSPISIRSSLELLSAIYSLDPAFGEARIISSSVNCRPALPHNEPRIYAQPGLIRINGLYRNGYLVAPAVAQEVLDLLENKPLSHPEMVEIKED